MKRSIAWGMLIAVGIGVSSCAAAAPSPSAFAYAAKGQSTEQASRDRAECQAWATQQGGSDPAGKTAKSAGIGAALGALTGAVAGAAIGAAAGNAGKGAAIGGAAGGIGGLGYGGATAYTRTKSAFDRAYAACMESRGYHVK